VLTVLARFFPATVAALEYSTADMAPAKLSAQLSLAGAAPSTAKLGVDGNLGKIKLALNGQAQVDPKQWRVGEMRVDGKLSADDGRALIAMLGLSGYVAVGEGAGALTLKADGPARGRLKVSGALTANGLDVRADGTADPFADKPAAAFRARVAHADAAPLRGVGGGEGALPVTFTGRVALAGDQLTLNDIDAGVAGTTVRGAFGVSLAAPHRLQGALEADRVDGAGLIAAAIGLPDAGAEKGDAWTWSGKPFGPGAFGDYAGEVAVKIRRLALLPRLTARQFTTKVRAGKDELALDDMSGVLDGGTFNGALSFKSGVSGVAVKAKFALADVESANLLPAAARPPVSGALGLSAELEGSGLSPIALIGALRGAGKLTMKDAAFAGLNPRAFDVVTDVVDAGLPVKGDEMANVVRKALDSGQLAVKRAEGKLTVTAGLVRLSGFTAKRPDADLSLTSTLDLTDGAMDARLVLSGSEASGRPDIFMSLKGPVSSPARDIDVSALTGWLTLRSVENQAKRLKALQEAEPPPAPAPPKTEPSVKNDEKSSKNTAPPAAASATADSPTSALNAGPPKRQPEPPARKSVPSRSKQNPPKQNPPPVAQREAAPAIRTPPRRQQAPSLPAPINIHPLPAPGDIIAPEPSIGGQR
jgi:large subunit ribosomal protein L24